MHRSPLALAALATSALVVFVPACGDDDADPTAQSPTSAEVEEAEEVTAPLRRLAIADDDAARLVVIDLDDTGARHEVELPAPASYSSALTHDQRFVLLGHESAVTVVDGGVWSEGHGDHGHHFVDEPAVVGTVDGPEPTHLISHDGATALWFDGLGEAVLLDEDRFADGELGEQQRIDSGGPHHGFAIAHGQAVVRTSPPAAGEDLPARVAVTDRSGGAATEHECAGTHGETSWSDGAAAACADGVLVLQRAGREWQAELVPYPDVDDVDPFGEGAARAWLLEPTTEDGQHLVAPLGTHHVLVLDTEGRGAKAIDVGAAIAVFGVRVHEPSGSLVVLTNDGAVHLVDPAAGTVLHRLEMLDPLPGEEVAPYRMLEVSGDDVFVSDPHGRSVVQLTIAGQELSAGRTHQLDFTPSFLGVLNG